MKNLAHINIFRKEFSEDALEELMDIIKIKCPTVHSEYLVTGHITDNIDPWCEKHFKGKFAVFNSFQYFQYPEDNILFILKWSIHNENNNNSCK